MFKGYCRNETFEVYAIYRMTEQLNLNIPEKLPLNQCPVSNSSLYL